MFKLLKDESDFPDFIKVQISDRTQREMKLAHENEDEEKCETSDISEIIGNKDVIIEQSAG